MVFTILPIAPIISCVPSFKTIFHCTTTVIADYIGTVLPDELIVIGGHIDSWDIGAG